MTALGTIYCVTNGVNGKRYVGLTTRPVSERWAEHCGNAGKATTPLHHAIAKYGPHRFSVEAVESNISIGDLRAREAWWIDHLGAAAPSGYNLLMWHAGAISWHPDSRKKASETHRRRLQSPVERERHASMMREVTGRPEYREAMSIALKTRRQDPELRARHSAAMRDLYRSPDAREKTRQATILRFSDPAERAATSEKTKAAFQRADVKARHLEAVRASSKTIESRIAKARGHSKSRVLTPDGRVFESLLEASLALSVAAPTLGMRCRHRRLGFSFVPKEDVT